jgi:hypothetical protein
MLTLEMLRRATAEMRKALPPPSEIVNGQTYYLTRSYPQMTWVAIAVRKLMG